MPIRRSHQRDFDDDHADEIDEGPSSADIEALDHETVNCPDCGAEIWDAAEICPKCFAYIGGNLSSRRPAPKWQRLALILVLALGLVIITLMCFMSPAFNQGRLP